MQLPEFVCRFEAVLEESHPEDREDGVLKGIRDGRVYNTMLAADGSLFFFPDDPSELRLAVTLHFDRFGSERGRNGLSYSSGVLCHCVANLPVHLRYQLGNLLLTGIVPGPKEVTCDELQFILEADVDDKKYLYKEGIVVKTPCYPNGHLVRIACIADCCNHPVLCRVCGFTDHSHTMCFCTRCKIPHTDLALIDGLKSDKYEAQTDTEHHAHSQAYKDADPGDEPDECEGLFRENGVQYYKMSCLPYFDAVKMSVIDPMHNILLSLCCCQWLNSWIHWKALRECTVVKLRELDQVHSYLRMFEMPSWVSCLPSQVGYPVGGSLSADEYKALVLVYCPIIIPLIWREWQPLAQVEFDKALKKWEKNELDPTTEATEQLKLHMHPDDPDNFLKLATTLKIILGRSIRIANLP